MELATLPARFWLFSREKNKEENGVQQPGREASFRPNLQRSYLNYSEKLISFFLPLRENPLNVSASDVDLAFKENLGMRITVQSW